MQDVELTALKNYEQNLEYLKKEEPSLFTKLQAFDIAQSEGTITPQYDLEYKDSYFDVLSIQDNEYLYGKDSLKYAQEVSDSINYTKNNNLFAGLRDFHITKEQLKITQEKKELKGSTIKDILPIMRYVMELTPTTSSMKQIDKFIFVGVGLGLHIESTHQKIHSSEYLIIEDDLELFRLSLFTTPYYELAKESNIHFAIKENEMDFTITMIHYLEGSFFNNRYIKYFHFPAHTNQKLKLIQNNLASQNHMVFPYDIQLQKILRPLTRTLKGYKTLNISQKFPDSTLSNKPALILAAGPSFKKNLDFVKKNHSKFTIIAVTAVLKTLHEHNIRPDIVTHIDGIETKGNSCMVHFEGFDAQSFLSQSVFILGAHAPDSLLALLNKENVYFYEGNTFYYDNFGTLSAPCVGSTTAILALYLNIKKVYLLGLDLALDQETGSTHSSEHEYNATHDLKNTDAIDYNISLRDNLIPIKGNFRREVFSTPLFITSVRSFYGNIRNILDDSQIMYNLNDGAFLEKTQPLAIKEIDTLKLTLINKKIFHTKIATLFNTKARSSFNENELHSLQKRLANAREIKSNIENYSKKDFTNSDQYLYDLLGIVSDILKFKGREGDNLAAVYASYFQYVIPYIVDMLNTQEVSKIMKHIQKVDKMFILGVNNIIDIYIEDLKDFLKK